MQQVQKVPKKSHNYVILRVTWVTLKSQQKIVLTLLDLAKKINFNFYRSTRIKSKTLNE